MPYLVRQELASISDFDIDVISTSNSIATKEFIVIHHENLDLSIIPVILVDGEVISLGAPQSNSPYEVKRIDANQTLLRDREPSYKTFGLESVALMPVDVSNLPIGSATIGSTFIIN